MPVTRAQNQGWKQKDHNAEYPRFYETHNPDLLRCELCLHGPTCKRYREGICGYAHAFKDLQPPNETRILYNKVWRNGVSRWYGQDVTPFGIRMFSWYYGMTAKADIPVWAHGLQWYISDDADAQPDAWPTDFGILMDFCNVTRARRGCEKPFVWAKDLENRFYQRWKKRPTPLYPFRHNHLLLTECMRDRRIVRSPSRPPPARIRQQSVDGIDQPTKGCIVEGMKDRRVVHSPPRPPPEKSRRMYSHDWAPATPAWQDLVEEDEGDLVEEDPMDAPEMYGFCGGGAWIPNTPEPRYRSMSTSPHRASSVDMHVGTGGTPRPKSSLSGMTPSSSSSSSFLRPVAMAYSSVPVWSSLLSFTGSDAPEVD